MRYSLQSSKVSSLSLHPCSKPVSADIQPGYLRVNSHSFASTNRLSSVTGILNGNHGCRCFNLRQLLPGSTNSSVPNSLLWRSAMECLNCSEVCDTKVLDLESTILEKVLWLSSYELFHEFHCLLKLLYFCISKLRI